jgi:DNA-binding phage protein
LESSARTLFSDSTQFFKGQALSNLGLLQKAFATNNLRTICKAIDDEISRHSSITEVCQLAEVNRTTLFRAFRRQQGTGLETMIRVLGVLGFRLAVTAKGQVYGKPVTDPSTPKRDVLEKACSGAGVARKLTEALNSSEVRPVIRAFADVLRKQDNIARLSKETIRCRETFYRAFVYPRVPRFSTALTLLDALGFSFSIRRIPRYKLSTRSPRGQLATAMGSQTGGKSRPLSIER